MNPGDSIAVPDGDVLDLGGTIPPMPTPVTGRIGDVDTAALRALTRRLVEGGVHGLFPCGSTGEFSSLTREQRRTVVETVADAAGATPVLAGCGATSVRDVRSLVADAAAGGADAAVVAAPYYLRTTQSGLEAFFVAVAENSPLPILLYNIPQLTGNSIDPETVASLAERDRIVGIKDSSGDLNHFEAVLAGVPDDFGVFQGATTYAVPSLDAGADGIVPGQANVVPDVLAEIYEAHDAGDRERAVNLMSESVSPITREITSMPTVPAVKYLTSRATTDLGPPLVPLPELSPEQRRRLDECHEETVATGGADSRGDGG
jgi:4-hydroxy-tetrahydrodipicolinate synthase